MLNMLFGEGQYAIKLLFAFIIIFGLLALALWLLRRFGGERLGNAAARGRQPRLAVIDQANVDSRRRLILVRRDNVEHLLMVGGPSDVVVEPNIVRGAAAAREPATPRPASAGDTLPRAVPLGEGNMWPLQPEPAPRLEPLPRAEPRLEPTSRPEPPPRIQRPARADEAAPHWPSSEDAQTPPSPPLPPARERRTNDDQLGGLAEELAREPSPADREPALPPRRQPPRRDLRPHPAPGSSVSTPSSPGQTRSPADHNLAEMAQRLEAALRRPAKGNDFRPASSAVRPEPSAEDAEETEAVAPVTEPAPAAQPVDAPRSARNDARPAPRTDTNAPPQRSLYDSLEQEMASLLGRPNNKQ